MEYNIKYVLYFDRWMLLIIQLDCFATDCLLYIFTMWPFY